ncbi:DHHC palmitoyltransferase-domain-containing protein [Powellomyces hirtus]|nr:DHHC palmitoyltransferase-domain-containing protein [Powellomyces hirtus]
MAPRKNGCTCPWSLRQSLLPIPALLSPPTLATLTFPALALPTPATIALIVLLATAWLVMVGAGTVLMAMDPRDWGRKKTREGEGGLWCTVCEVFIEEGTMHCKYCNKCISGMDHHCYFVNSCIGTRNYRLFITGMLAAFTYTLPTCILSLVAFSARYTRRSPSLFETASKTNFSVPAIQIINFIHAFIAFAASVFVGDLLRLHVILYKRNMTTLQYSHWLRTRRRIGVENVSPLDVVTVGDGEEEQKGVFAAVNHGIEGGGADGGEGHEGAEVQGDSV